MKSMTTQPPNERMSKKPPKDPLPYLPNDELPYLIRGYPKLAGRMAKRPEQAIFRRFDELNARNMLYIQAELCKLELQIRTKEMQDKQNNLEYSTNYEKLAASHDSADAAQIQLIEKIKEKLKDYSMCPISATCEPEGPRETRSLTMLRSGCCSSVHDGSDQSTCHIRPVRPSRLACRRSWWCQLHQRWRRKGMGHRHKTQIHKR
jgi:hypothetical protein